jgi:hypothetical protein
VAITVGVKANDAQGVVETISSSIDQQLATAGFVKQAPSGYAQLTSKGEFVDYERAGGDEHVSYGMDSDALILIRVSKRGERVSDDLVMLAEKLAASFQTLDGVEFVRVDKSRANRLVN